MYKICNNCGVLLPVGYRCPKCKNLRPNRPTPQQTFRKSYKWQKKRLEIVEVSNYLCSVCRDKGIITTDNIGVHHITPLNEDMTKKLDNDNLIALCYRCHTDAERGKIDREYLYKLVKQRESNI